MAENLKNILADEILDLNFKKDFPVCLEIREQRRTSDAVRDTPEAELFKEVRLIERIKGALSSKVQQNFNQLTVLRHCRAKIQADVMDKSRAHGIDTTCKTLSEGQACYRYDYKPALLLNFFKKK